MKISEVKERILANETIAIEMMRNPAELSEFAKMTAKAFC